MSPECLDYLRNAVRFRRLKKKEFLLRPGAVCMNMYFIKKGLVRCFYFEEEKEVTDWFFWERATVVSVQSYYYQKPSVDFIQALEDCELFYISYADLEYAFRRYPEFNYTGRVLTLNYFLIWHALTRNLRGREARQKFELVMEQQPEVFNRVPLRDLATWLDMTPSTLSRLRRDWGKK